MLVSSYTLFEQLAVARPYGFTYVNNGRYPTSPFPFLGDAFDLSSLLMSFVRRDDLRALALVDRDCRQLARSHQFATVVVDFSKASLQLLGHLREEATDSSTRPKIGPCIRKLVVTDGFFQVFKKYPQFVEVSSLLYRSQLHLTVRQDFTVALGALSHLQILDWKHNQLLQCTQKILDGLALVPLCHLSITGVPCDGGLILPQDCAWSLQTLHLRHRFAVGEEVESQASLFAAITAQSSKAIRSLLCHIPGTLFDTCRPFHAPNAIMMDLETRTGSDIPPFRHLVSDLRPPIRFLRVAFLHTGCLPTRQIESMEALVWRGADPRNAVSFICRNRQLQFIGIDTATPHIELDILLVHLCAHFHSLTTLTLQCEGSTFPTRTLRSLGELASLQSLALSVYKQDEWSMSPGWQVDHALMSEALSGLLHLERLAFAQDHLLLTPDELATIEDISQFTLACARSHAIRYGEVFPKLRWCFVMEYPLQIDRVWDRVEVKLESDKRMDWWMILDGMWMEKVSACT